MSDSNSQDAEPKFTLPDLHESVIDRATLLRLFEDIETCAVVIEVLPKFRAQARAPEGGITLEQGRSLLLNNEARAIQIRYRYQGAQWWDTIMTVPNGYRIVRIEHRF